jgi:hypothetical protein
MKAEVVRELSVDFVSINEKVTNLIQFRNEASSLFVTQRELLQTQFSGSAGKSMDLKIAPPERFTGKRENCKTFIAYFGLYLDFYPHRYTASQN